MDKIIKALTAMNEYYKKFLYILIPSVMIILHFLDLVFLSIGKGSVYVTANVVVIAAMLILTARYLYYHKEELFCLCGTLSTAYISIILFIAHIFPDMPLIVAVLFLGTYAVTLVITFMVRLYEMRHNGR